MQPFPYASPLGPPHPLAALLTPPDPAIGAVIAGDSTVDVDGYALDGHRTGHVGTWWSPLRSIGTTLVAFFFGGGIGAFVSAMGVGLAASVAGLPQSLLQPLVLCAGALGVLGGTALAMRFSFALSFHRTGENVLVGERGVSVVRLRAGALDATTFTYDDPDLFWGTSQTRYVRRGSGQVVGDGVTHAWVDGRGQVLYESRGLGGQGSPHAATLALAMQRRAQVRGPVVRAALARGEALAIPILFSPDGDSLYAQSSARPRSFLRFGGGTLVIELDGAPVARFALGDLKVVAVDGKCLFRSKSGADRYELRMQDAPDTLLLAALFP